MTARLYRLTEIHQRIDQSLRAELIRRKPDKFTVSRLTEMKLRVKFLLNKLAPRPTLR